MFVSRSLLRAGTNTIVVFEQVRFRLADRPPLEAPHITVNCTQDAIPASPVLTFEDHYIFANKVN